MRLASAVWRQLLALHGIPPPGASVDPAYFAEADYPVFCMVCGYELRGLPEARCPECGEGFERGRLLIEQYVRGKRPRSDRRYRVSRTLWRLGWAMVIAAITARLCLALAIRFWKQALLELMMRCSDSVILGALRAVFGVQLLGAVCLALSAGLWSVSLPPRAKRQAITKVLRALSHKPSARGSERSQRPA